MLRQGSDVHVLATIADGCCTIQASFFFDPKRCPRVPDAGEKVRLIGTQIQEWHGHLQLGGKNIQFGDPVVFMSLSNAIAAWNTVKAAGAQRYFPKLTTVVAVVAWGNATVSRGAQLPSALVSCRMRAHSNAQVATCMCLLSFLMRIALSKVHFFSTRTIAYNLWLLEIPVNSLVLKCRNGTTAYNFLEKTCQLFL
jgi:hypothetical protein